MGSHSCELKYLKNCKSYPSSTVPLISQLAPYFAGAGSSILPTNSSTVAFQVYKDDSNKLKLDTIRKKKKKKKKCQTNHQHDCGHPRPEHTRLKKKKKKTCSSSDCRRSKGSKLRAALLKNGS